MFAKKIAKFLFLKIKYIGLALSLLIILTSCNLAEKKISSRSVFIKDGKTITVIDARKNSSLNEEYKKINGVYHLTTTGSDYSSSPVFSKEEINDAINEISKNISFNKKLTVKASTTLTNNSWYSYSVQNLIDSSINNAWAEGNEDNGIGEYLEFTIINDNVINVDIYNYISIFNGYRLSSNTWNDNSRVKKIKLSINDNVYALVDLKDTPEEQIINLPDDIMVLPKKNVIVKFEILEVYKGDKYKDTCISGIDFGLTE